MHYDDALVRFDLNLVAAGRSPHTIASYLSDARALGRWLGEGTRVGEISAETLTDYLASDGVLRKADGSRKAAGSVNKVRGSLRAFFGFLVIAGVIDKSPAQRLTMQRFTSAPPEILSIPEEKRLLKTIRARKGTIAARDRVLFELFLGTGIRLSSLVGLDIGDVRLDDKRLLIKAKGGQRQTVFLRTSLRRLIRSHILALRRRGLGDGPLFISTRGTRLCRRQVQIRLRYWLDQAQIAKAITVHGLRHTFGSRLYARTQDLRLVQRALGHRNVTTTQIYVQLTEGAMEDAMESM